MAGRVTLQIGDLRLKAENAVITAFTSAKLLQVIQDLADTMHQNNLVGMAAPQIGENYKIFVTEARSTATRVIENADGFRVYINPQIIEYSQEQVEIYEGCGCVANAEIFAPVIRSKSIVIEAFDEYGKKFRLSCDGLLARVIQHEYDHLLGIEFIEKISDLKKVTSKEFYIAGIKNTPETIAKLYINNKTVDYIN